MPYYFTIREGAEPEFKLKTYVNLDTWTVTAEFTEHPYAPVYEQWGSSSALVQSTLLDIPVLHEGKNITIVLLPEEVDLVGNAYYRLRAERESDVVYFENGKFSRE